MSSLDICSVSFHNAPHLELNWALTERLNPLPHHCRWLVAENTPEGAPDRLSSDDARFELLPGASKKLVPNYQHTEALHGCLARATSRFVLILDPDFYLVRPNWIDEIIRHMKDRQLSFFGAPWHASNTDKYRYFPCVHCLFVDQERLPLKYLDLRPDRQDQIVEKLRPEYRDIATAASSPADARQRVSDFAWKISGLSGRRKNYCDTGTRFYHRFRNDRRHKFELAQPVLRLPEESPIHLGWKGQLLEAVLPDSLCYLPKRKDSFTGSGLREAGYLKNAPRQWEEFMWKQRPFAFHVRRNRSKDSRNASKELAVLVQALEGFQR